MIPYSFPPCRSPPPYLAFPYLAPQVEEYIAVMEKVKLRDGIRLAMAISADGNKFLQDSKPWAVFKEDKDTCASLVTAGESREGGD